MLVASNLGHANTAFERAHTSNNQDCMDYVQTVSSSSKLKHNHFNKAPDAGTCNLVYNHKVELLYGVMLTGN